MTGKELGNYLKLLRVKNNLTMTQTATIAGVTQGYISQIENGIYTPSAKTLAKLARAYGVPELHLLQKAGIVNELRAMAGDSSSTGEATIQDPWVELSDATELMQLLRRGLSNLEHLGDHLRQRTQLASLTMSRDSLDSHGHVNGNGNGNGNGTEAGSSWLSLPIYDACWQPQSNAAGEPAVMKLPLNLCADDREAFILIVGDKSMEPRLQLGDWVIISPAGQLSSGDVAAVNTQHNVHLRQFMQLGETRAFTVANSEHAAEALVDNESKPVEVVGRVVRVVNRSL